MVEENFLDTSRNADTLVRHFAPNLHQYSFKIIAIVVKIKQPDLRFLRLFFDLHGSVAMPDSLLDTFRYTGYRWLARAYGFKKLAKPAYVEEITSGTCIL